MKIVLATGIYPPDIGGPATYAVGLEKELRARGHDVLVLTYGRTRSSDAPCVFRVSRSGGMIRRWLRYRDAFRTHAADADVVLALSSVSVGVPLVLSRIKKPKKILRLGGEFFWERFTDAGGSLSLAAWHKSRLGFWRLCNTFFMHELLSSFDSIVYSTDFQKCIHQKTYRHLPPVSVIENAVPMTTKKTHVVHTPLRLLFVGRLVRFKNVPVLLDALSALPDAVLTITGDGPQKKHLLEQVRQLGLQDRVTFLPPIFGDGKAKIFSEHDLLVIPSVTEISPNVALEAVSAGLPVLLTSETGLSDTLSQGMLRAPMSSKMELLSAIVQARLKYPALSHTPCAKRSWPDVCDAWISLFAS